MTKYLSFLVSFLLLLPLLTAAEPRKTLAGTTADPKKTLSNSVDTKNAVPADVLLGGYQPIKNISDPYIQSLGKFAVDKYNKEAKANLHFQKVINGSYQIVAGTNYNLRLTALDGVVSRIYGAIVYKDLKQRLHLNDFFGISRN